MSKIISIYLFLSGRSLLCETHTIEKSTLIMLNLYIFYKMINN
jgi:hypothetical protein